MLQAIILEEIPGLVDFSDPFSECGIDSFGLVVLRGRIEAAIGRTISDEDWCAIDCPKELLSLNTTDHSKAVSHSNSFGLARTYNIGMPQMAMSGLSESWMLKEIGDLHWCMIADGLQTPSSNISDEAGNRLYATFTRISYDLSKPLRGAAAENSRLDLSGHMTRFGSGTFNSEISLSTDGEETGAARLMSNFSRRGSANSDLLKGQPKISSDNPIPISEPTDFTKEYRARKTRNLKEVLFESEYELIPFHDINGVGLLYFAAYPIINDICAMRHLPRLASEFSTKSRDICYFANADVSDPVVFRIHAMEETESKLKIESSMTRKSDGGLMAHIYTEKARV